MTTKREMNQWLKNNLPVYARVMDVNVDLVVIGADPSVNLSALAEEIRSGLGASKAYVKPDGGFMMNHLTIQF